MQITKANLLKFLAAIITFDVLAIINVIMALHGY